MSVGINSAIVMNNSPLANSETGQVPDQACVGGHVTLPGITCFGRKLSQRFPHFSLRTSTSQTARSDPVICCRRVTMRPAGRNRQYCALAGSDAGYAGSLGARTAQAISIDDRPGGVKGRGCHDHGATVLSGERGMKDGAEAREKRTRMMKWHSRRPYRTALFISIALATLLIGGCYGNRAFFSHSIASMPSAQASVTSPYQNPARHVLNDGNPKGLAVRPGGMAGRKLSTAVHISSRTTNGTPPLPNASPPTAAPSSRSPTRR